MNGRVEPGPSALNLSPRLGAARRAWAVEAPGLGEPVGACRSGMGMLPGIFALSEAWLGVLWASCLHLGLLASIFRVLPACPLPVPPRRKLFGTPLSLPCCLCSSWAGAGCPPQRLGHLAGPQLSLVLLSWSAFPPHPFLAEGRGGSPGTTSSPSGELSALPDFPALGCGWSVPWLRVADGGPVPGGTP